MKLLLDTHIFLWMHAAPDRLAAKVQTLIADPNNDLVLSAASAWEISIKASIGRLTLPEPPDRYVPDRMLRAGVTGLSITHNHVLAVASLARHHRDPFDRLLIVQSIAESIVLVTADPAIMQYDLEIIDARER